MALRRLFSTFPGGWPGLGLLLLRLAVGSIAVAQGVGYLAASSASTFVVWLISALAFVIGASLMLGFLTPLVSITAAFGSMAFASTAFPKVSNSLLTRLGMIDSVIVAVALAILGAGAFSLDAYLFGRREIIIPDISRSTK